MRDIRDVFRPMLILGASGTLLLLTVGAATHNRDPAVFAYAAVAFLPPLCAVALPASIPEDKETGYWDVVRTAPIAPVAPILIRSTATVAAATLFSLVGTFLVASAFGREPPATSLVVAMATWSGAVAGLIGFLASRPSQSLGVWTAIVAASAGSAWVVAATVPDSSAQFRLLHAFPAATVLEAMSLAPDPWVYGARSVLFASAGCAALILCGVSAFGRYVEQHPLARAVLSIVSAALLPLPALTLEMASGMGVDT